MLISTTHSAALVTGKFKQAHESSMVVLQLVATHAVLELSQQDTQVTRDAERESTFRRKYGCSNDASSYLS